MFAGFLVLLTGVSMAEDSGFSRLVPLSSPTITSMAQEFPGGRYKAVHLLDGNTGTEFASQGKGTNTFVEFDFGSPVKICGFQHQDRNDPAVIAASELIFSDSAGTILGRADVKHVNKRAGVTTFALSRPVEAQHVRWNVTAQGSQHGCLGGAEIMFFTSGAKEKTPTGIGLEMKTAQAVERRGDALVQSMELNIDYPYAEPTKARVIVEGQEPQEVELTFGSRTLTSIVPASGKKRKLDVSIEINGKAVVSQKVTLRPVRNWVVYILMHSHVDIGYTDLQPKIAEKQVYNITRALELIKETKDNPEGAKFKWNAEVFWPIEKFLAVATPEQKKELEEAVRSGDIGIDAMYGNLLTGVCRAEELLQQFYFATEYGRQCGVKVDSMMISDVPGLTWGIVPALAHAGVKYISNGPNATARIGWARVTWEDKPFYWVSQSGKEKVLYWAPYQGYSYGHTVDAMPTAVEGLLKHLDETEYPYDIVQLRWSKGDNGPADERVINQVREWNEKYASPKLVIATTSEIFHEFEKRYAKDLKEYRGDFTPYWEDGVGSSAYETGLNRRSADRLVQAQALWAMLSPTNYPAEKFAAAWKNVTMYSEHTWGAHNSVSAPDEQFVKDQWKIKQAFALDADRQSRELVEAALAERKGEAVPNSIDVFNTRAEAIAWARIVIPKELLPEGDCINIKNSLSNEHTFVSQRLTNGDVVFRYCMPPLRSTRIYITTDRKDASANTHHVAGADGNILTNSSMRLRVDEKTGAIASLRWKQDTNKKSSEIELVDTNSATGLNDYFYLPGADLKGLQSNGPVKISVKERGPIIASLLIESEAPGCRKLTREIRMHAAKDYVEIINTVDKLPVREKESVHFGFGFNVPDGVVSMNVPFGVMEPEKDQIPGACKNWFSVERWVNISNKDYGVTWVTMDAPLVEMGGITANLVNNITDPKEYIEHIEPSSTIYSWAMNNHWFTNYRADQEGPVTFRYLICPDVWDGDNFSLEQGQPPIVARAVGETPENKSPFRLLSNGVCNTVFKPSEDGKGWIIRLFGASGKDSNVELDWSDPKPSKVWLSDASERPLESVKDTVTVPACGIVTLRAER